MGLGWNSFQVTFVGNYPRVPVTRSQVERPCLNPHRHLSPGLEMVGVEVV